MPTTTPSVAAPVPVTEKDIERIKAEDRLRSAPPTDKVRQVVNESTNISIRRNPTPLRQQASLEIKSSTLLDQSKQAGDEIRLVQEFVQGVKDLVEKKQPDPETRQKIKQQVVGNLDRLVETIRHKSSQSDTISLSEIQEKIIAEGQKRKQETPAQAPTPEPAPRMGLPHHDLPQHSPQPAPPSATSAPSAAPVATHAAPHLADLLEMVKKVLAVKEEGPVKGPERPHQTESDPQANLFADPSSNEHPRPEAPFQIIDRQTSRVHKVSHKTEDLLSQVAVEVSQVQPGKLEGGKTDQLSKVLDSALQQLHEGRKTLQDIQSYFSSRAANEATPAFRGGESPPQPHEAEKLVQELVSRTSREDLLRAHEEIPPEAVVQLLF